MAAPTIDLILICCRDSIDFSLIDVSPFNECQCRLANDGNGQEEFD